MPLERIKMKIRNGFVSNSSSSSFIVAFPRKPESVKDVIDMLFGGFPDKTFRPDWDDEYPPIRSKSLAAQIFDDIQRKCPTGMVEDEITEQFLSRYYYCHFDNSFELTNDGRVVCSRGWGSSFDAPFFGVDTELLNKLADAETEEERFSKNFYQRRDDYINDILNKRGVKEDTSNVVLGGIKEYWKERGEVADSLTHDPNWITIEKDYQNNQRLYNAKVRSLSEKVARSDAKAFLKANEGNFIVHLEYGDNHGGGGGRMGSILENGNVWNNISHVVINHH